MHTLPTHFTTRTLIVACSVHTRYLATITVSYDPTNHEDHFSWSVDRTRFDLKHRDREFYDRVITSGFAFDVDRLEMVECKRGEFCRHSDRIIQTSDWVKHVSGTPQTIIMRYVDELRELVNGQLMSNDCAVLRYRFSIHRG